MVMINITCLPIERRPSREHDLYVPFPARATHDARCLSVGFYPKGKVNGQRKDTEAIILPLGVAPCRRA